jgi:hypothetical protein
MNLDLGTMAGVLGVVLTVIFFIFGYRQTIGARKERAAAASREIAEILLRRLTLEPDFSIGVEEIDRFIAGKSLENRTKRSDVISLNELWILLYSRVVSSDNLSAKQRKPVLEKINRCFRQEDQSEAEIEVFVQKRRSESNRRDEWQFALLGTISTLLAAITLGIASNAFVGWWKEEIITSFVTPLIGAVVLSIATSALLAFMYSLKERTVATRSDGPLTQTAREHQEFEKAFLHRLRVAGLDVLSTEEGGVDFVLGAKGARIAVEVKLYSPSASGASAIVKRISNALPKLGCEAGYLVVGKSIPASIRDLGDEKTRIVEADEFFRLFIGSEISTGRRAD